MPGAYTFSYGTSGTLRVFGKHTHTDIDGTNIFEADFLLGGETDAELNTAVLAINSALINNKSFTLLLGAETELSIDPAVNTGFLTRATLIKVGDRIDTARSARYRLRVEWEAPPGDPSRAGRREATIDIAHDSARQRTVTFAGVWTALAAGGIKTSIASYDAGKAAFFQLWIDAANDGSGSPVLSTAGRWVLISERPVPEDEDKRLSFNAQFKEELTSASFAPDAPGDARHAAALNAGILLTGNFTRIDPERFGQRPSTKFETVTPAATGSAASVTASRPPFRVQVTARAAVSQAVDDPTTGSPFKADVIGRTFMRPWIVSSIAAIFGVKGAVYERISEAVEDIATKDVVMSATLIASAGSDIISVEEVIDWDDDRRLVADPIWNGLDDAFELSEGGRRAQMTHRITVERLRAPPVTPSRFSPASGVQFMRQPTNLIQRDKLDVLGSPTDLYTRVTETVYLKVLAAGSTIPIRPQPLGEVRGVQADAGGDAGGDSGADGGPMA